MVVRFAIDAKVVKNRRREIALAYRGQNVVIFEKTNSHEATPER